MVAGNGLLLPQRQFIQFASYPLLRSEERLGKRAAGSWLNVALECNGRLLFNHIFSLRGTGCRQETGSCAVQRINSMGYAPTKHWATTSYCTRTPRKFRASENTWALPRCRRLIYHGRALLSVWGILTRNKTTPKSPQRNDRWLNTHHAKGLPRNGP